MEKEISNIILGKAGKEDRFKLKFGWFKFNLSIKPITAKQIIEISAQASQISEVKGDGALFPTMVKSARELLYVARVISIATGTKYRRIVTNAILRLSLDDIHTLMEIVKKQSNMERFFFILIGMKGLNQMKMKKETEEQ